MTFKKTEITSMKIKKFRSLSEVPVNIGSKLTLIAGRNGTSKSTILGILAQICSFEKNYTPTNKDGVSLNYKTIYGGDFFTEFKSHFRISDKYDLPTDKYEVKFSIIDAQEQLEINPILRRTTREGKLRFVLRKDNTIIKNKSRNITHPSIYLGLERLLPISQRDRNIIGDFKLSSDEKKFLIDSNNSIFTSLGNHDKISSNMPKGKNGINSTVVTNDKYDVDSASSGEDNIGQILMSLLSFKRLKSEWPDYKGGLLFIDEIDASLFPKAQIELFNLLMKESKKLNLQIFFTTHSPTLISHAYDTWSISQKNARSKKDIQINYLSDSTGKVKNYIDFSLADIIADLNVAAREVSNSVKINCYYEDTEAYFMSTTLLKQDQKKLIHSMKDIKLGCENYISLIKAGVPEFKQLSLIVLDGDVSKNKISNCKNIATLPSTLPPDQLMYKFLNDLDPEDNYWKNTHGLNKLVFINHQKTKDIRKNVEYNEVKKKYELSDPTNADKKCRDYFKEWFNYFHKNFFKKSGLNPIIRWRTDNMDSVTKYQQEFSKCCISVLSSSKYLT